MPATPPPANPPPTSVPSTSPRAEPTNPEGAWFSSLSTEELAAVEAAGERDRVAWADEEAQQAAREVAEDVFHALTYAIAHGEVTSLESLRAQWNFASLDEALVVCRRRATTK